MVSLPPNEDTGSSLEWGVAREAFRSAEAKASCCRLAPSRRQLSLREAALDLLRTFGLEAAPATEKRHG